MFIASLPPKVLMPVLLGAYLAVMVAHLSDRNSNLEGREAMIRLLMVLAALSAPLAVVHPQKGSSSMDIIRKANLKTVPGPEEFFTGKVTITGQFQRPEPSRVSGAIVHFEPGARTAWHTHPAGQTLIVTEGVGWTQIEGGPKYEFLAGDIMWCPKDKKHWHGATSHDAMTHIAIQESVDGTPVKWMEKVSDEDYLAPVAKD